MLGCHEKEAWRMVIIQSHLEVSKPDEANA